MKPSSNLLIWIDLEMTGLNPLEDRIIEIATVVTDQALEIVAEGPVIAISQPKELLQNMDEWNTKQHNRSGLVARVLGSTTSEGEAELKTLDFLSKLLIPNSSPMCGNSICQDRRFLSRYMPALEQFFHYRNLDVSTIKELAKYWRPSLLKGFKKKSPHLAMEDIKESIEELRYYRSVFFKLEE